MTWLKEGDDPLGPQPIIDSSRKVSRMELWVTLALVLFGGLPLGFIWSYLVHQTYNQQEYALLILLGLMSFCVIETFAIIYMVGLQRLVLPPGFLHWLGAATVGEVAGLLIIGLKYVFLTK